jgi:hypothetical protein
MRIVALSQKFSSLFDSFHSPPKAPTETRIETKMLV